MPQGDTQADLTARAQSNGEITRLMIGDVVVRTESETPFWRGRFKELAGEINRTLAAALQSEREAAAAEARRAAMTAYGGTDYDEIECVVARVLRKQRHPSLDEANAWMSELPNARETNSPSRFTTRPTGGDAPRPGSRARRHSVALAQTSFRVADSRPTGGDTVIAHLVLAIFWFAMTAISLSDLFPEAPLHKPWMLAFFSCAFGIQITLWGQKR